MWDISRIGQYGILLLGISSEASRRRGMEKVNSFREPVGAAGFCAIWQRNGEAGIRKKQHNCKLAFPAKTEEDIMCDMKKIDSLINASEEQKAYLQSALMYSPICWKDGRFKFDREPCGKDCYTCMYDTFGELVQ